jgi:hypothetical protein
VTVSIVYEIRSDAESADAPVIKKITYSDGVEVFSSGVNPLEIKAIEPDILEQYFLVYKSYLNDYLNSFSSIEEATSKESINYHVSAYAITYYFKNLAEMMNPTEESSSLSQGDEEL